MVLSATIDVSRFSRYFSMPGAVVPSETEPAPIIEIAGEGHPVKIYYDPAKVPADGVLDAALHKASSEIIDKCRPGDILIFLAGQVGNFVSHLLDVLERTPLESRNCSISLEVSSILVTHVCPIQRRSLIYVKYHRLVFRKKSTGHALF